MNKLIAILFLLAIIWAGKCNKEDMQNAEACTNKGEVVDYTGLDGCGLMIKSEDGTAYEVVAMPEGATLNEGDQISFDFIERTDMASICMAGKMIEVTCYRVVK